MGCAPGKVTQTTKDIDQEIKKERKAAPVKLLLLGTGDSGKSTFARQMKVIYQNGFSKTDLQKFTSVLRDNTLQSIQVLVTEAIRRDFTIPKKLTKSAEKVRAATQLSPDLSKDIEKLWSNTSIQKAWGCRNEFQIPGVANYYFENVGRLCADDFVPNQEDIFRAKLKTTGIVETVFQTKGKHFLMVDVGGQRTERRKWLHSFEGVSAVIFLAALDEFDMPLAEDGKTNRMEESLRLFGEVSGSQYFKHAAWILFLNKVDLFGDKIKSNWKALKELFPDYDAGTDVKAAITFVQQKYTKHFSGGKLYVYPTCAIDTKNVDKIFSSIQDTVLVENLTISLF